MDYLLDIGEFKLWFLLFGVLCLRYFLIAGLPYFWLYKIQKKRYSENKLQKSIPHRSQILKEIGFSILTMIIYSSGIWLFLFWLENGYTTNYMEISDFGWLYFVFSITLMILIHYAYSYWLHRLIHHRWFFKNTHLLHHTFKNTSPFSAFAFHPFESILTMGVIPIIIFTIPWHNYALIIFITIMIFYDTFVHLGYDLRFLKVFKFQNTPVEHDIHHRNSKYNFGLYFTIWDRLMGTYKAKS